MEQKHTPGTGEIGRQKCHSPILWFLLYVSHGREIPERFLQWLNVICEWVTQNQNITHKLKRKILSRIVSSYTLSIVCSSCEGTWEPEYRFYKDKENFCSWNNCYIQQYHINHLVNHGTLDKTKRTTRTTTKQNKKLENKNKKQKKIIQSSQIFVWWTHNWWIYLATDQNDLWYRLLW